MSLFKQMLASVGIGAATVDTLLEKEHYHQGEEVKGVVRIHGGDADQKIDQILIHLMTQYTREINDSKVIEQGTIATFPITESFTIHKNEQRELEFSFQLPFETPVTIHKTKVWLKTGLDIKIAVDPKDTDTIKVEPHPFVQTVRRVITSVGFRQSEVEQIYLKHNPYSKFPVVQEFEYKPTGLFRHDLDELEVIFFPSHDYLKLVIEIDKRSKGVFGFINETLDLDDQKIALTLSKEDLALGIPVLAKRFEQFIQSQIGNNR